jgi:hypothetical protein
MRKLVSVVLLLSSAGVYAFGDVNCNGNGSCAENDNSVSASVGDVKQYGGDTNVGNGIGNFSPKSEAEAYALAKQLQLQGNVGLGSGNDTSINISGKNDVDAQPAIAPAIAPGDPTAPCYVTLGGSVAGGGVAALGFSGYKYDTICGAMELYRVLKGDPAHAKQVKKAVDVAYHNLMNRMWNEMGDTEYNKATGEIVAESGTTASHTYPTQDGGFMKVSFTKLGAVGMDAEEVGDSRDVAQSIRD